MTIEQVEKHMDELVTIIPKDEKIKSFLGVIENIYSDDLHECALIRKINPAESELINVNDIETIKTLKIVKEIFV